MKSKFSMLGHAIKQIDKTLGLIFMIAIICLVNYECLIIKNPWPDSALTGLNKIIVQVFYAYITGLIFYFIIELFPREKKKVAVLKLICNNASYIDARVSTLLAEICKHSGRKENDVVTWEEFKIYCDSIQIHTTEVKVWHYPQLSYKDFVLQICNEVNQNIEGLITFSELLDENWINKLVNLTDNIRHILNYLDVNESQSKLDLVAYNIWDLNLDSKILIDLLNEFYSKNQKIHRQQRVSTWAAVKTNIFMVTAH
jgi:hypothetical protein